MSLAVSEGASKVDGSESAPGAFVWINLAVILIGAVWLRAWKLDHLPAVNGDECWYGNFALDALNGRSPSFLTPNRNPVNPFYILPVIAVHALASPSILLLRSLPVLLGLLTLGINFAVARRLLGSVAAIVSTGLLAVMAVPIAYSRFAWDATQLPLITALLIYSSIDSHRRPGLRTFLRTWGLFAAALLIHPTCVFLGPIPFLATQADWLGFLHRCFGPQAPRSRQILGVALLAVVVLGGLGLAGFWLAGRRVHSPTPASLLAFVQLFADLFTGRTIYRYISGAPCESIVWPIGAVLFLAGLIYCLGVLRNSPRAEFAMLVSGYLAAIVLFFLIAGPGALRPGYERYGVFLVSPTVIIVSIALSQKRHTVRTNAPWAFVILCYGLLLQFQWNYMRFLETTGGESAATFHTNAVDPKLQASRIIRHDSSSSNDTLVFVRDFHLWQSLRYFLSDLQQVRVDRVKTAEQASELLAGKSANTAVWIVSFGQSDPGATDELPEFAAEHGFTREDLADFSGRPAVLLFKLE